jgi:trehalose 6-phosphate phosphatase
LSEIVARPELARPVEGAAEVLGRLARRYAVVAVVTGRRSAEVEAMLAVPGVAYLGLYGFEDEDASDRTDAGVLDPSLRPRAEAAAAVEPAAWVEDKGASLAIHYRQAGDPQAARERLAGALRPLADEAGLRLVEGNMVVELLGHDHPMKGAAVERLAARHRLEAVLYAGDDRPDLDAFAALGRLAERGVHAVRVAVRGAETSPELVTAADVVVDGPRGLLELLAQLA